MGNLTKHIEFSANLSTVIASVTIVVGGAPVPVQAGYCNYNGYCDASMGESEEDCPDCPGVPGCETFTCEDYLQDCLWLCGGPDGIGYFECDFECNATCICRP